MYLLDTSKLEIGDILLTAQKKPKSKGIRLVTRSDFSHAMLYVTHGSYIHADGDGVHSGNTQLLLFEQESYVKVLRVINSDKKLIEKACFHARREIGKQYSIKDAINTKIPLLKSRKSSLNRQFCSRLVAQAYENVGIKLVKNSDYCVPQELDDSELTIVIENCVRKATPEEIKFAKSDSPIEKQTNITNQIFKDVRRLTGEDLQNEEQLISYLLNNPKYDFEITNIVKNSGYLSMWCDEVLSNPWRYDGDIFLKFPISKAKLREQAQIEISSAKEELKRREFMRQEYMKIWQLHKFSYAMIHVMLYEQLLECIKLRIKAGEYVLNNVQS